MTRPLCVLVLVIGLCCSSLGADPGNDPKSNNKDKIVGKWKITALPEKAGGKKDLEELTKFGLYVYVEFKADGGLILGIGADKKETLDLIKKGAPDQKLTWDAKYKLLVGDAVEIYDLPKDLQNGNGGLFGKKDRAKMTVKISDTEMKMIDDDGTATLKKLK